VVSTTTLDTADWAPTTITAVVRAQVAPLKDLYAGEVQGPQQCGLAQTLDAQALVDKYRLFVEPVVHGTASGADRNHRAREPRGLPRVMWNQPQVDRSR
jgi:hypothetical protein